MTNQSRPRTSSRTPASRPRRIAGQGTPQAAVPGATDDARQEVGPEPEPEPESEPDGPGEPPPEPQQATEPAPRPGLFAGGRVTVALLVAIVVLTAATLAMAGYLRFSDDEQAAAAPPPEGEIAVPEGRPIQLPWADAQAAAAAAAEAATTVLDTSFEDYDAQLTEALALMTPSFAEEFRTTATDSKTGVVEGKLEIAVRVIAQSVVRANTTEVQALLFLDQYTTRGGEDQGTTVSPYRVLVTMVNTDGGWLISDLETR